MTTLVREDFDKGKNSSSRDDVESFRTQGYESIDSYCYYRVRDRTMLVVDTIFEDLGDTELLSMEDYLLSLDDNSPKDNKKISETLIIQCAFHVVRGGNISCKVTQVQGGYTFRVPSWEVAREISRVLLRLIEEVESGDSREKDSVWKPKKWEMFKELLFYAICFLLLVLLGYITN